MMNGVSLPDISGLDGEARLFLFSGWYIVPADLGALSMWEDSVALIQWGVWTPVSMNNKWIILGFAINVYGDKFCHSMS